MKRAFILALSLAVAGLGATPLRSESCYDWVQCYTHKERAYFTGEYHISGDSIFGFYAHTYVRLKPAPEQGTEEVEHRFPQRCG